MGVKLHKPDFKERICDKQDDLAQLWFGVEFSKLSDDQARYVAREAECAVGSADAERAEAIVSLNQERGWSR